MPAVPDTLLIKMIIKKHVTGGKLILAICDASLLNKKIETETQILDLSSNFYKGEPETEEKILDLVKKAYIINAVGEKSTNLLIKKGIIAEEDRKQIKSVPFVQVVFE